MVEVTKPTGVFSLTRVGCGESWLDLVDGRMLADDLPMIAPEARGVH